MYEMKGRVRYSEVDSDGRLTIPALINYLQDCCTFQSEDLGVGLPYLRERGIGWFVTSWWIHVEKLPAMGEHITVKTWPYAFRGFLGYRNFTLENEAGEVPVEVNSLCILMEVKSGKPARLPEKMKEVYVTEPALERDWGDRKRKPDEQAQEAYRFVVQGMHIDTNGHMNNEKYVAAAQECLPEGFAASDIYVEYKKSAMRGDEIICVKSQRSDGMQVVLRDPEGEIFSIVEYKR